MVSIIRKLFQMNVYMKYKCQNKIGLIFQKELILARQMHQNSVIFVIVGTFQIKILDMSHIFVMVVINLMQKALNFNDAATVSVKGSNYRTYFQYMAKNNAINIMKILT